MSSSSPGVDKISKMIYEEASRKPGADLILKLLNVMMEAAGNVLDLIAYIRQHVRMKYVS